MTTPAPSGILPFGSSDPSVLLQCSMTSSAAVAAVGGAEVAAVTYDRVKGVSVIGNSGLRWTSITGYSALDNAGQISFEIETTAIATNNASYLSTGASWAGNVHFLVCGNVATPTTYARLLMNSGNQIFHSHAVGSVAKGTNPQSTPILNTSFGKTGFCRYTYSWIGDQWDIYLNGVWVFRGNKGGAVYADLFKRINVLYGDGLGNSLTGYFVRNLIVANQPAFSPVHRTLGTVAFVGHSFVTRSQIWSWANNWCDHSIGMLFRKFVQEYGFDCYIPTDNSTMFGSSGATILHSGGNPISTQVTSCVAKNPNTVVYIGGTNDVINASWAANRAQVLTDIKSDITSLLGASNCQRVIVANVPSTIANSANYATANNDANVLQINADFEQLPAWWDANNPSRIGAVKLARVWERHGGSSPGLMSFWGSANGTYTDLHPSSAGAILEAKELADVAVSFLR